MDEQPQLADEEWGLVIELLQWELHDLPAEIHHSRVSSVREELRHREEVVRRLLARLQQPVTT
jgi:hypothetical protein